MSSARPAAHGGQPAAPAPDPLTAPLRRGHFTPNPPRIVLEREISGGEELFILDPPIRYDAVVPGHDELVGIVVPRRGSHFRTDLTSVPTWFTWLVPKSGEHLPAALIHDGLVPDKADPSGSGETGATYETVPPGITIDRIDADRIFRDAMFDTHVGAVRCYLVWAAVSLASLMLGPRASWRPAVLWYYRVLGAGTGLAILAGGYAATVRLLDSSWPAPPAPWIVDGPFPVELATGLAGAVAIPLLLSVLWWRYWQVAAIAGIALATLLHVTLAVGAVAFAYQLAEWVVRRAPRLAAAAGAAAAGAAVVVFLGSLAL